MSDRAFFDTNILLYPLQENAPEKREQAHLLLARYAPQQGVISYQVLQEFCNACFKRFSPEPRRERVQGLLIGLLEQYEVVPWSPALLPVALDIRYRYRYSWYDSLILAAAIESKCETLYSEDMQHMQKIDGLTIVNPFV